MDAFWPELRFVAEYRERQHSESTPFFDKPKVMTVSGEASSVVATTRRDELIPARGITLLIVNADQLACDARGRLRRERGADRKVLAAPLRTLGILAE